jgi:hypothetical integral membrane protein (TIGR02206 family)
MSSFQVCALLLLVVCPLLVWWLDRRPHRRRWVRLAERGLAAGLLLAYAIDLLLKWQQGILTPQHALPMQLCDWALLAMAPALWWRWRPGFDVAYFWGFAGTLQALLTPEVAADVSWLQKFGFFFMHAGIVGGVIHLMLTARFRPEWPRSLVRVVLASECYLASALAVNALTGSNYGFLSRKPNTRTMLDLFSDERWLYALQLNLTALLLFAVLYLPWAIADLVAQRRARAIPPRPEPPFTPA